MTVPGYNLVARIAQGGFGDVWKAHRKNETREYAIKLIRKELIGTATLVARFEREIALSARLNHPNIVPILEYGTTESGVPYFVMPLVSGTTLRTLIRRSGSLPLAHAKEMFGHVCSGIQFAHEAGVVHRDIKSSNVLVDDLGKIQICDFGIAKLLSPEGPNLTLSREVLGTPACMAPEQALGGVVDQRADIYALGIMLYEMLEGGIPFSDSSLTVLAQLHSHAKRPQLSERLRGSSTLNNVIATSMRVDPSARYSTVANLWATAEAAFDRAIRGNPNVVDNSGELHESWLLFLEDQLLSIIESEDLLDEIEDEMEEIGLSLLVRGTRRMLLVVHTSRCDEEQILKTLKTVIRDQDVALVLQKEMVHWKGETPAGGTFLESPWPTESQSMSAKTVLKKNTP